MNGAYQRIIAANNDDRRGLFLTAANRVGTTVQNIEKDFWVCWTLDALFHRLPENGPRLLFKGGTSLSKGYGLISRFSEDIDVTVFRHDLVKTASIEQLETLSKKKQKAFLEAIKEACRTYIEGKLLPQLNVIAQATMESAGQDPAQLRVVLDQEDVDKQSLLIHYPTILKEALYVRPSVKIESGAKSALDPNEAKIIIPYLSPDFPEGDKLAVPGVTTIDSQRTFLDKILILHGMKFYFAAKETLRGDGRMSRHYYDVHRLIETVGKEACGDQSLIEKCVRHARMFFYRKHTGLEVAERGSFQLYPTKDMLDPLRQDYDAMATMIFGEVPAFEDVLESVRIAEELINKK